jgi:putative membrane protein
MAGTDADQRWPRAVFSVGSEPDPRFTFANERTFLAWIRTALGFVAAGVALAAVSRLGGVLDVEVRVAALLLVLAGLVSGVGAWTRWFRNERALRLDQPLPSSPLLLAVTGIVVLASAAAVVVVFLA